MVTTRLWVSEPLWWSQSLALELNKNCPTPRPADTQHSYNMSNIMITHILVIVSTTFPSRTKVTSCCLSSGWWGDEVTSSPFHTAATNSLSKSSVILIFDDMTNTYNGSLFAGSLCKVRRVQVLSFLYFHGTYLWMVLALDFLFTDPWIHVLFCFLWMISISLWSYSFALQ